MVSTSSSGSLQWQLSATSLCPTLYSKGWTKCPSRWALTFRNRAKCVTIVWLFQIIFATMITHVSPTAMQLNTLSSLCNSLHSGNICHMLPQKNSMMLRYVYTQRWNQATGGGINRYVSWILSKLRWFWPLHWLLRLLGATIVPLFSSSDQTHLTNYSGYKNEGPVNLSLGNIDLTIRSHPSNLVSILVGLLPVPPKYHFTGHRKTTAGKEQQIHNREVLRNVFDLLCRHLDAIFNTGKFMLCANGQMQQCEPVI